MGAFIGGDWTFSADGNGATAEFSGGKATLTAIGTYGSGTLKWQRSVNGGTWVDITSATGTSNYDINIECSSCLLRPVLSGSTNPTIQAKAVAFVE